MNRMLYATCRIILHQNAKTDFINFGWSEMKFCPQRQFSVELWTAITAYRWHASLTIFLIKHKNHS
jgi:hypothetical protein